MKNHSKTTRVYVFTDKCFGEDSPFYPYYEKYKGHTFIISKYGEDRHVLLRCVSDRSIIVDGYVHLRDLKVHHHNLK